MKRPLASGRRKSTPLPSSSTPKKLQTKKLQVPPPQKSPSKRNSQSGSKSKTPNASLDVSRRTRRFKRGTKALREIKALQRSTSLLMPKASFCRVVKETMAQFSYHHLRIQSAALQALQEAAEMYMVQMFEDALLCTLHAKRVTLMCQDVHLVRRLRGPTEVCN